MGAYERGGSLSKYHNKKTEIDGITFDSKKEAQRYCELKMMLTGGVISDLYIQPEFILQEGFKKNGKTIKPIKYFADFKYYDKEKKQTIVEDVKGVKTEVFRIKKKLFDAKYPDLTLTLI